MLLAAPPPTPPQVLCARTTYAVHLSPAGPRPPHCRLFDLSRPNADGASLAELRWSSATRARGRVVPRVKGDVPLRVAITVSRPVAACTGSGEVYSRMRLATRDWSFTIVADQACSGDRALAVFAAGAAKAITLLATNEHGTAQALGAPDTGSGCTLIADRLDVRELWTCVLRMPWTFVMADGTTVRCDSFVQGHLSDADRPIVDTPALTCDFRKPRS